MQSSVPIQTPVTGSEYAGNQQDKMQALAQFYRALNSHDLPLMQQNWANSADAIMDNPLGGIKRGWDQIKPVYQALFESGADYSFEFFDYTLHESADFFYVVGRERGKLALKNGSLQLAIRTTRLFRREKDLTWRQVHHHGSIEDPRALAAYQDAVLNKR